MEGTIIIRSGDCWLRFSKPREIISSNRIGKVLTSLREVERLTEKAGLYAAGFISYEASPAFDSALKVMKKSDFPLLWFGIYSDPERIRDIPACHDKKKFSIGPWEPDISREKYDEDIERIYSLITGGHTYQVNYTFRMRTGFTGSALEFFRSMMQNGAAPYGAFIDTGRFAICSASPELFFDLDGNAISCRPMKGTVKRGLTTSEDMQLSGWLRSSEKNRAENIMITDMIRNDLGRIARSGSVHVPSLFDTERHPGLWQMTSTIRAGTECGLAEVMKALFPCASITGAPKARTMEIIRDIESSPRGLYTGCIGYTAPGRRARFSVAIRTVTIDRRTDLAEYGTGGGIVFDSTSHGEYDEALLKACSVTNEPPIFRLFETILLSRPVGFTLLARHLDRMEDSADYFGFSFSREKAVSALEYAAADHPEDKLRIKLLLSRDGAFEADVKTVQAPSTDDRTYRAAIAAVPVSSQNVFLYHKTTERSIFNEAMMMRPGFDDVLLYNERGEITEFTIGNFAARFKGMLVTPPASCGLLAGTLRAEMLETGLLSEKIVLLEVLDQCEEVYMINSVRGMQKVKMN